jgi:hypothetical protein
VVLKDKNNARFRVVGTGHYLWRLGGYVIPVFAAAGGGAGFPFLFAQVACGTDSNGQDATEHCACGECGGNVSGDDESNGSTEGTKGGEDEHDAHYFTFGGFGEDAHLGSFALWGGFALSLMSKRVS